MQAVSTYDEDRYLQTEKTNNLLLYEETAITQKNK